MRTKLASAYYAIILLVAAFLFFTNNFGLIDVQKTALVIAVGVDRTDEEFVVTSQIALPKPDSRGEQDAEIVGKGKTIAQALERINAKTGWYPKLVFCQLVLLGESATSGNVFDILSFFLRNEYLSDGCLVAACEGSAQELLSAKNPVETLSGLAISKVLSDHAEQVGTALPSTLREFSQRYYAEGRSGYMPIVKAEAPKENDEKNKKSTGQVRAERNFSRILPLANGDGADEQSGGNEKNGDKSGSSQTKEKVFSASETALFLDGKRIARLNEEETYALAFAQSKLRLAYYGVSHENEEFTLSIKRNSVEKELDLKDEAAPKFKISITVTAGLTDKSRAETIEGFAKSQKAPKEVLRYAERKLSDELRELFMKTKALGYDLFDCVETLKRKEYDEYFKLKDTVLDLVEPVVEIKFRTVR